MSVQVPDSDRQPPIAKRQSKRWVWFFLVLALLTVLGISLETWFNLAQQLKPDRVAAARRLWEEKGPRDYDLEYTIGRKEGDPRKYIVRVREGRAASAPAGNGRRLSSAEYPYANMEELFGFIEKRLEADRQPGSPQAFVTADFAPEDGRLIRYVRSVRRTSERLKILVTLRPVPPVDTAGEDG